MFFLSEILCFICKLVSKRATPTSIGRGDARPILHVEARKQAVVALRMFYCDNLQRDWQLWEQFETGAISCCRCTHTRCKNLLLSLLS